MRGVYTVQFNNVTANAADTDFDFFEIDAAADKPVEIVAIRLDNVSEVGDAAEEMLRLAILRFSGGTFTSGGELSTTPVATDPSDGAASFAAEAFNSNGSAASSSGTTVRPMSGAFNVRTGETFVFPPEMRVKLDGTAQSAAVVRCESTVADDTVLSGTLWVREL